MSSVTPLAHLIALITDDDELTITIMRGTTAPELNTMVADYGADDAMPGSADGADTDLGTVVLCYVSLSGCMTVTCNTVAHLCVDDNVDMISMENGEFFTPYRIEIPETK